MRLVFAVVLFLQMVIQQVDDTVLLLLRFVLLVFFRTGLPAAPRILLEQAKALEFIGKALGIGSVIHFVEAADNINGITRILKGNDLVNPKLL